MEVYKPQSVTRRSIIRMGGAAMALPAALEPTATNASTARGDFGITGIRDVRRFGARGDTVLSAEPNGAGTADILAGSDDTAAIQAAIDFVDRLGGGTIFFPEGRYKISSYLTCRKNVTLIGAGRLASVIVAAMDGGHGSNAGRSVRNGSALYSGWPSNASNNVHIRIQGMGFHCPSPKNVGAAFYDNCGTGIWLDDCFFSGFKYGVVFDQTEVAHVNDCFFWKQLSGGAGMYIVNGPTLTVGNSTTFTNQISAKCCQFNEPQTSYGILDEGGYTHSFVDNNYNGCLNHLFLAGAQRFKIDGGEFEASRGVNVQLDYRRIADASPVGGCTGQIVNAFLSNGRKGNIHIASSSGPISVRNCQLSRADGRPPISGANNASRLNLSGNYYSSTTAEAVDGHNLFYTDARFPLNVRDNNGLLSQDILMAHANSFLQCTNPESNILRIRSDKAMARNCVPIGTVIHALQSTPTGSVTFAAGAGVTLLGPTRSTSAHYDELVARKVGPDTWLLKKR
jgi:hypothetical protein